MLTQLPKKAITFNVLVLIVFASFAGCAQKKDTHEIAIAFYNCENFFDIVHNPAKDDEEFTPGGKYHYTQRIYEQKLHNIATVLQNMGGDDGPAIVGMAEVENSTVLTDLAQQPEIAKRNYKYAWFDGPDPRGINVALLYNPKYFTAISSEPLHVDLSAFEGKSVTRDVLHVYGVLAGDTVDVFVNHWPSRRGGEEASDAKRAAAAQVDKDAINTILKTRPAAKIIVMGDLNDNPTDASITGTLGAKAEQSEVAEAGLYDPWINIYKGGAGTESFRGSWNLFDQVIISGSLLANKNHKLQYEKAEIYRPDFIVDHYKGHDGEPHRSFVGTHWINGYSDHFPVILYLSNSKFKN
jgi:endonuclease/exonuclease/phosphatase family metal-dependent hydrolase